jgi:hypothetical protein
MNRRELILALGGAMTVARGLRAQRKAMPVVGALNSTLARSQRTVGRGIPPGAE